MLFFITLIALLKFISAFAFKAQSSPPLCSSCKHFIPNVKIFDDLGLCKMFNEISTHKGKQYTLSNYAIHCRENENLCGKAAHLFEPKETPEVLKKSEEIKLVPEPSMPMFLTKLFPGYSVNLFKIKLLACQRIAQESFFFKIWFFSILV